MDDKYKINLNEPCELREEIGELIDKYKETTIPASVAFELVRWASILSFLSIKTDLEDHEKADMQYRYLGLLHTAIEIGKTYADEINISHEKILAKMEELKEIKKGATNE